MATARRIHRPPDADDDIRPVRVSISLSYDEAQRLDDIRGLAPRATWVRQAAMIAMQAEEMGESILSDSPTCP